MGVDAITIRRTIRAFHMYLAGISVHDGLLRTDARHGLPVSESDLYAEILRKHSHGPTRLFRQQSCMAWAGKVVNRTRDTITLLNPHAIKLGTPGIADLGGLTSVIVTEAMVGQILGVYLALECKFGRGRATTEQKDFIAMVNRLGGRAGVVRSSEDAGRIIIGGYISSPLTVLKC